MTQMSGPASVRLIPPTQLEKNPENPRLIFREDELQSLEDSISAQGILVPLTVYSKGGHFVLLDGERRWMCALKLGLLDVPAIVQPEPDQFQNIMMMFAIHNARRDWDPLPTAYKLRQLEAMFTQRHGFPPKERELANLASLQRGEVRRLKRILELPEHYQALLMDELKKPRSDQRLTVDVLLETTRGAAALQKRQIITSAEEIELRDSIVEKFATRVTQNTVEPRQLARIARAVERGDVPDHVARRVVKQLISDPGFTIAAAYSQSVEGADWEHSLEQLVARVSRELEESIERGSVIRSGLRRELVSLRALITRILG